MGLFPSKQKSAPYAHLTERQIVANLRPIPQYIDPKNINVQPSKGAGLFSREMQPSKGAGLFSRGAQPVFVQSSIHMAPPSVPSIDYSSIDYYVPPPYLKLAPRSKSPNKRPSASKSQKQRNIKSLIRQFENK
jgi:hypothetical protein